MMEQRNTPSNGAEKRPAFRERLPVVAVYIRYLLPALCGILLLVMGCFYSVFAVSVGVRMNLSPVRLCLNTVFGAREYLTSYWGEGQTSFYALQCVAAVVTALIFLLAAFFSGLAAYTALMAFRKAAPQGERNRMKLIFKIAFPNRIMLFLSGLLYLLPALYPHIFSAIGKQFMATGGEKAVFIRFNAPLLAVAVCNLLILVLSLYIAPKERELKMDMFTLDEEA